MDTRHEPPKYKSYQAASTPQREVRNEQMPSIPKGNGVTGTNDLEKTRVDLHPGSVE